MQAKAGLSPLTRGNRASLKVYRGRPGPIPAHAGQPLVAGDRRLDRWAYPRSRGATTPRSSRSAARSGLSPLTRGNRGALREHLVGVGPIPAHAGQPPPSTMRREEFRAYPRSRGATDAASSQTAVGPGLSPLTRGNPSQPPWPRALRGPIPAHAGQPQAWRSAPHWSRAYPRSRGATLRVVRGRVAVQGLSPLTRGNPAKSTR